MTEEILEEQPAPTPPPFQLAMMMQAQYQQQLQLEMAKAGGAYPGFSPLEMYLTLKTLIAEVTALRELMFDIASTGPEGMDKQLRMQHYVQYCHRLSQIYRGLIVQLNESPKLIVPN